jgi:hypothetical protein
VAWYSQGRRGEGVSVQVRTMENQMNRVRSISGP